MFCFVAILPGSAFKTMNVFVNFDSLTSLRAHSLRCGKTRINDNHKTK